MGINRRTAIAIVGSALPVAMAAKTSATDCELVSKPVQEAVASFRKALSDYREAGVIVDRLVDGLPGDVVWPLWEPETAAAKRDCGHRLKLRSMKDAAEFFDELIAMHSNADPLDSSVAKGRNEYVDRLEKYRASSLADLGAKEVARAEAGLDEALKVEAARYDLCEVAFATLIEAPCLSYADVQAKLTAFLEAGDGSLDNSEKPFGELTAHEARRVLLSIGPQKV